MVVITEKRKEEIKPKLMEWGIINKENYTNIKDLPIKRWDPLSTVSIDIKEFGLQKKVRNYGHYSYLSPIRGKRPKGFHGADKKKFKFEECKEFMKNLDIKDVFMSVTEGKPIYREDGTQWGDGYTIIITEDEKRKDNPFEKKPHKIEKLSDDCKAVTLINRYPSMARVVDPEIQKEVESKLGENSRLALGINLVTISREFYPALCFDLIPEETLSGILNSMKSGILYCVEESINRDYYDIPVTPFFNIGTKVGGSQPRIHGQVYIDLNGDGHGSRLEGYLEAFKEMGDQCHLCLSSHGGKKRIVLDSEYWIFYTTGSPVRNYHLRFHPKEHIRRFSQLNINQISDLSHALKKVFLALDKLEIDQNRNIIFNGCPYGYDANFHLFGDIIPHEIIGGAEMAEDMRVARKLPEDTAEELKEVIKNHES
ncbi:MAG: hypothetical protein R6U96_01750 [Promethearchaeia archaeon]